MYEQFGVSKQSDGAYAFCLFVPDNTVDPSQSEVEPSFIEPVQSLLHVALWWCGRTV